jgi:two-component system cell cycle sensor histidine kinase/response regulator CckA
MTTYNEFSPGTPERSTAGVTVLVVDDEVAVRRYAVRVLQHYGYLVSEAGDGAEALDLVRGQANLFGLVLSDIVMPRLNGVELLQALAESHPDLPVILMSGYATGALAELGIVAPCGILAKPFAAERLLAEVERCIRRPGKGVEISSA